MTLAEKNNFLISLSTSPKTDVGKVPFEQQSEAQKVFTAIWVLEGEVNNGGFAQYLSNDAEGTAPYAPIALNANGATQCAAIVTRALQAAASHDEEALETLDQEFFTYPDNLTELLYAYVMANPTTFA